MSRTRIATVITVATLAVAGVLGCGGAGPSPTPSTTPTPSATARPTTKPTTTPTTGATTPSTSNPPTPTHSAGPEGVSAEQRNATRAAMEYLSGQNFSRTGLIKQLKYEGYSVKSSTAAVDSLHMDWNEQAALVARDYLQSQAFSKKSLTGQLEYDGFTSGQAAYGVAHSGL